MKKSFIVIIVVIFMFVTCLSLNNYFLKTEFSSDYGKYNKISLVIDPGHGGIDAGTSAYDGTNEKVINLAIALNLYDFAVVTGLSAYLTRNGDYLVYKDNDDRKRSDLYNRYDYINSFSNAVLVSVHQNFFEDKSQWGMQVWYSANNPESQVLSDNILKYDKLFVQPKNERINKVSDDSYYLLYKAKVPSVMVECGFMSNESENEKLKSDEYRRKIAFCILAGVSDSISIQ